MPTRKPYSSDLSTLQWHQIRRLIPPGQPGGRPRTVSMREVVNAILYRLTNGCKWKELPHDFPPHQTVYEYYNTWVKDGTWERIHWILSGRYRRLSGRKRHILVDTIGLPHKVDVHRADIQDRDGGKELVSRAMPGLARLLLRWLDGGYAGQLVESLKQECQITGQVMKKLTGQVGFVVLHRRWVVERTFAWLDNYRLLDKERETRLKASEANIYAAFTHRLLRRLGPS